MDLRLLNHTGAFININKILHNSINMVLNNKLVNKSDHLWIFNSIENINEEVIIYHFIKECYDDTNRENVILFFIWIPNKIFLFNITSAYLKVDFQSYNSIPNCCLNVFLNFKWIPKLNKAPRYHNYEYIYPYYYDKLKSFYKDINHFCQIYNKKE